MVSLKYGLDYTGSGLGPVVGCSFSGTTFSVSDIKLVNDLRVIYSQTNILYCLFSMLSFEVLFL
jgi:hypothetical protein